MQRNTGIIRSVLQKIKQVRCLHENIDLDLGSVEAHDKNLRIAIKVTCTDCGKHGYNWYEYQETEI